MNKILVAFKIRNVEPLISLQIKYSENIPVWPSFICGQGFTGITVETLKRGEPGKSSDVATPLPPSYVQRLTTDNLTTGDWTAQTGSWPCFIFNPGNDMYFKPGVIDEIIILGLVNNVVTTPTGLLFGIFDEERNLSSVDPFVSPIPSVNTYTFTRNERLDVTKKLHSYFFVNKQNTIQMPFENPNLAARFIYSPDTYLVLKYTENIPYTPYDLISAVGGLTTYAIAIWFVLFGRGKYRSWGLVQRYLLRNSPDARKKDNDNSLLPISYEKSRETESKLNDSTIVGSPTSKTLSSNIDSEERPPSIYYFTNSGTPTQSRFPSSLSPNSFSTPPFSSASTKDLNKRIDAKINQKLWYVEQTLSRHYLSGFRLRKYDVDLKKLGLDTSYDDDVEHPLTPPVAHHNWNNIEPGVRSIDQNSHKSVQIPVPSFNNGSQYIERNNDNNSINSLNPEEQRAQYPNVAIGQVPFEKKQRGRNSGSGNYQQFVNTSTSGGTGITPSSYYSQMSYNDNVSNDLRNPITSSQQIQIPSSLQVGSPQNPSLNPSQNPSLNPSLNPSQGPPQIPPQIPSQGPPQIPPQVPGERR